MIQAKKTWYNEGDEKKTIPINVAGSDHAWNIAHGVFKARPEAYCITMDTFGNGAFVIRVMSKVKMILKLEHQVN